MRTINVKTETIGESIDSLALAFSGEGDTNGLYILERARERAEVISSQDKRERERAKSF
jgi:hypothetical protein